jgi:hypothetical protein
MPRGTARRDFSASSISSNNSAIVAGSTRTDKPSIGFSGVP